MNAKQRRRQWCIGLISSVAVGLACADDEARVSDSGIADAGTDDYEMQGGEGDDEGREPGCGNGRVELDEACDDGNATDDDQCTNACRLPACGDGILQLDAGESCDDGNNTPGDGCTMNCNLRGALLVEHTSDWFTFGTAVVVDSNDQLTVSGRANGEAWIAKFDDHFNARWSRESLPDGAPGLAIGTSDELLIAGRVGEEAHTKRINPGDGAELWTKGIPYQKSTFTAVAAAEGHLVASGYWGPLAHENGVLARLELETGEPIAMIERKNEPFGPVVVDEQGWVWVIVVDGEAQLNVYDAQDQLRMTRGLPAGVYVDIAVDEQHNVYVLARSEDEPTFMLWKYLADGTPAWSPPEYLNGTGSGLALAPDGTVLVAGCTSDESDGLLVWYEQATGKLVGEAMVGMEDQTYEVFKDVAIAPSGKFAVAVGGRGLAPNNTSLWIYELEL